MDLVVYPNGDIIIDDMDEPKEALKTSKITELQYNRVLTTSQKLQDGLLSDIEKFQDYVREMLNILKNF